MVQVPFCWPPIRKIAVKYLVRVILVDEYFFSLDSRRKRGRRKSQGQKYCRTITCLNLNLFGTVCALLLLYLWQNKYQCVILLCVTIVPWQQRIFMTQDNFQFVSFFSCFDKKIGCRTTKALWAKRWKCSKSRYICTKK